MNVWLIGSTAEENGWRRMELKYRRVPCEEFTYLSYAVNLASLHYLRAKKSGVVNMRRA